MRLAYFVLRRVPLHRWYEGQ